MNLQNILRKGSFLFIFLWAFLLVSHAQETGPEHHRVYRHHAGLGFGFTFIPLAGDLGTTQASGLFVPSVGLDYFFRFAKKWEAGLMLDYELDHYMIVDKQIERDNAFLATLIGKYTIGRYWKVFAGGGIELEPHDHLAVLRLGTEYTIEIGEHWALVPIFYFDFKENYDTWSLQLSIARSF
jgi:hypothetical protein